MTVINGQTNKKRKLQNEVNKPGYAWFRNASPEDIDNYIDTNVTDLAEAKSVLKFYGKILSMIFRLLYQRFIA